MGEKGRWKEWVGKQCGGREEEKAKREEERVEGGGGKRCEEEEEEEGRARWKTEGRGPLLLLPLPSFYSPSSHLSLLPTLCPSLPSYTQCEGGAKDMNSPLVLFFTNLNCTFLLIPEKYPYLCSHGEKQVSIYTPKLFVLYHIPLSPLPSPPSPPTPSPPPPPLLHLPPIPLPLSPLLSLSISLPFTSPSIVPILPSLLFLCKMQLI